MAGNTLKNFRRGAVKNRSQYFNKKTNIYLKRDKNTGRFLSGKNSPYKGITKEKTSKVTK